MRADHDIVVIGGGQAGLAMSAALQQRGREHVVLERRQVGERWRTERWDSLRFQFPNWSLQLPGYTYSGPDADGFAHWREILHIIENHAVRSRTPVHEQTDVTSLRADDDTFVLAVAGGTVRARVVVVATGPFQRPRIPRFAHNLTKSIAQTDPTRYRRPDQLPDGPVLVVGSGASGCQIADELLHSGRTVFLSVSRHRRAPRRFRGKDVYWWLERMGRLDQTIDDLPDRRPPAPLVVTGAGGGYDVDVRRMAANGIRVIGRVLDASQSTLTIAQNANQLLNEADQTFIAFLEAARQFAAAHPDLQADDEEPAQSADLPPAVAEIESLDLRRENVAAIVWATGYEYDYDWLHAPVLDREGRPLQRRGVTPVPNIYFLGLHWMHTLRSGLLSGVGGDAVYLADHMDYAPRR
jgi:putative flavoprotein involved in K+ transport